MKRFLFIIFIIFLTAFVYTEDNTGDENKADSDGTNDSAIEKTNNVPVYNGWELFQKGRYSESIETLKKEMQNFPNRINIYVILGWDYYYLRRYSDMENISLVGLKIRANDTRLVRNLAESYFYQRKYKDAIETFEKYIFYNYNQNDPYIPSAYYYLGICFYNLGSYMKSDIALSTANYFQPNNYRIILQLAEAKEKLEEFENARKYYDKVLQLKSGEIRAIDGLKRIEKD